MQRSQFLADTSAIKRSTSILKKASRSRRLQVRNFSAQVGNSVPLFSVGKKVARHVIDEIDGMAPGDDERLLRYRVVHSASPDSVLTLLRNNPRSQIDFLLSFRLAIHRRYTVATKTYRLLSALNRAMITMC